MIAANDADAEPSDHADDGENHERQGDTRQGTDVLGCEDHGDADKQHSQDSIEGRGAHLGRPGGTEPGADQRSDKQVDNDGPMTGDVGQRYSQETRRDRDDDDDQAHGLVYDHGLERDEAEQPDRRGSRNSAPPRPTSPPSSPIPAPIRAASHSGRPTGRVLDAAVEPSVAVMSSRY